MDADIKKSYAKSQQDASNRSGNIRPLSVAPVENQQLRNTPRAGILDPEQSSVEVDKLCEWVAEWLASLEALQGLLPTLCSECGLHTPAEETHEALAAILASLGALPELEGNEVLEALPRLSDDTLPVVKQYLEHFQYLQALEEDLAVRLSEPCRVDADRRTQLEQALELCASHGLQDGVDLNQLSEELQQLDGIERELQALSQELMGELQTLLGGDFAAHVNGSREGLLEYATLIECVAALPEKFLGERHDCFEDTALDDALKQLSASLLEISQLEADLEGYFDLDQPYTRAALKEIERLLGESNVLSWFQSDWWVARKMLLGLARGSHKLSVLQPLLSTLIKRTARIESLNGNEQFRELFGDKFQGADTDVGRLLQLRNWYRETLAEYSVGFGPRVFLGRLILDLPRDIAVGFHTLARRKVPQGIRECLQGLDKMQGMSASFKEALESDGPLVGPDNVLAVQLQELGRALNVIGEAVSSDSGTLQTAREDLQRLAQLEREQDNWLEQKVLAPLFGQAVGFSFAEPEGNIDAISRCFNTLLLAENIQQGITNETIRRLVMDQASTELFQRLRAVLKQLDQAFEAEQLAFHTLQSKTALKLDDWGGMDHPTFGRLIERCRIALSNPEAFSKWLLHLRQRPPSCDQELAGEVTAPEEEQVNTGELIEMQFECRAPAHEEPG